MACGMARVASALGVAVAVGVGAGAAVGVKRGATTASIGGGVTGGRLAAGGSKRQPASADSPTSGSARKI